MRTHALMILLALALIAPACFAKKEAVSPFAMQLHSMEGDVAHHQATLDLCRQAGIKLIRDEIHWDRVEREKGVLEVDDNILQNVENTVKAGIEPMIILDYGNKFYDDGNAPVSKEAVEGFVRYCEFMARTFKGKIKYWEVWNEPNTEGFWRPTPNPKDYGNLLKAAYQACRKGNSDCTVIGIVTAGVPLEFIEAVLKEGTSKSMDILSVHPYRYPSTPEESGLADDLVKVRGLMERYGMKDKPLWITEIGWPTHIGSKGVTPERQANMLVRAYIEAMSAGVETIFWYWFGNDGPDRTYNEDNFGIRFQYGSPKPAYIAYQAMTQNLAGAKFSRPLWAEEKARIRIFATPPNPPLAKGGIRGGQEIGVLWATEGVQNITLYTGEEEVTVEGLPMWQQQATPVDLKSMNMMTPEAAGFYGATGRVILKPVNGLVTLTLTELPCYVTKKSPFAQEQVMPGNQFQFLPPQMTVAAGEPNDVGFRVANVGDKALVGKIVIHSDLIAPNEIEFKLEPKSKSLLLAKINTPDGAPGSVIRIPAEVIVGEKLCASLLLMVTLTPPAAVEITPDATGRASIEVRSRKTTPFTGKLIVTATPPADSKPQEIELPPIEAAGTARVPVDVRIPDSPQDTLYTVTARVIPGKGPAVEQTRLISFVTSGKAKNPITIDGKLDEWKDAVPIHLDRKEQIAIGAENWQGADDGSGVVYLMWDELWLYVAARVRDDVRSADIWGEKIYNNDGIELYFDSDLQGDRAERRYSKDDSQYGCFNSPKGPVVWNWQPSGGTSQGGKCAFVYDESLGAGGYIIEAKIPMPEISLLAKAGVTIGFTTALDDDDSPGSFDTFRQECQLVWAGGKENWLDPTQFAQITLVE